MNFIFTQLNDVSARAILTWRDEEPDSFYNVIAADLEKDVQTLTNPDNLYDALTDESRTLVAYFCFGREAQVVGGDYSDHAQNIGAGVRSDLTGRGQGSNIIHAGLDFGRRRFVPRGLRVTVAAFNQRALRLCKNIGFSPVQKFFRDQEGTEFVVLLRPA